MTVLEITVLSSVSTGQSPCLHGRMSGTERTKGAPVYEQEIAKGDFSKLRSSRERGVDCNIKRPEKIF